MELGLFEEILDKARALPDAHVVTFNSYNEPTICPHFLQMLKLLSETRFRLILHTNATRLTPQIIAFLAETELAVAVIVNLPSLDAAEFRALTGVPVLDRTLEAADRAIAAGLPVRISANGTLREQASTWPALQARFGPRVIEVASSDRAGLLGGGHAKSIAMTGRLRGCDLVDQWVHIAVNGNLFICCEDYHQNEVYGNIRDGSFEQLLSGPRAVQLRRRVYGDEDAPENFICRRCEKMQARFQ
jgi:radical SAM protein with 4Fe4S-binding SPASM domain